MNRLSERIKELLVANGIKFAQSSDGLFFRAEVDADNSLFPFFIDVDNDNKFLIVESLCPLKVPFNKFQATIKMTNMLNLTIKIGKFELDTEDANVIFETGMKFSEVDVDCELLEFIIFGNLTTLDFHMPAISAVLFTDTSAKEALTILDNGTDDNGSFKGGCNDDSPPFYSRN